MAILWIIPALLLIVAAGYIVVGARNVKRDPPRIV